MISVHFQGKPFNMTVIQVYAPTTNAEEAEVEYLWRPARPSRPSRTNTKKDFLFLIRNWNAKAGNQEIPGVTGKFGLEVQNESGKANRILSREYTGHMKHPLPTTQEMTLHVDITRWSVLKSDWSCSLQPKMEFYIVSKNKTWSWPWLRSWVTYWKIQA